MSDSNELKSNTPPGTPVPDLIEQYRIRLAETPSVAER